MNAREAKREAQRVLDYFRQNHNSEDGFGSARCVGYAWQALARIAGDTGLPPWTNDAKRAADASQAVAS